MNPGTSENMLREAVCFSSRSVQMRAAAKRWIGACLRRERFCLQIRMSNPVFRPVPTSNLWEDEVSVVLIFFGSGVAVFVRYPLYKDLKLEHLLNPCQLLLQSHHEDQTK